MHIYIWGVVFLIASGLTGIVVAIVRDQKRYNYQFNSSVGRPDPVPAPSPAPEAAPELEPASEDPS